MEKERGEAMQAPSGMSSSDLRFLRCAGLDEPPGKWVATNRELGGLIRRHGRGLQPAAAVAAGIRAELEAIFPLIDAVCQRTCPWCPDPCCIVTRVWYDFIDLLFLHLIEAPLPPGPLAYRLEDPCRYLASRGCRLPRLIRPWGCTQYTCPVQYTSLRHFDPAAEKKLDGALGRVRESRYQLEAEFQREMAGKTPC